MPSFFAFYRSGEKSMNEEIFGTEIITGKSNSTIVKINKLVNKKYRNEYELFMCDGTKLVKEAIAFGANIKYIVLREDFSVEKDLEIAIKKCRENGTNILVVSEQIFAKISTENAPQGIIAICSFLKDIHVRSKIAKNIQKNEKIMMFESVRDPGNIGTIIRNAVAFGLDRIILSSDCADIYSQKVVSAAMGAIFKLKIDIVDDFIGTINELKAQNKEILSATLGEKSLILGEKALNSNTVVIIGNEGHGLSKDVISISNDTIFIPIKENTESLNAAMASVIFMWELSK